MDEWSDSVRIAVDLLVACVIISALLVCIMLGGRISNFMDNNAAAAADVRAYRTANAYDGTKVYPQDIVNLILTNQGEPGVYVYDAANNERCHYDVHVTSGNEYTTALTSEAVAIAISAHSGTGSSISINGYESSFLKDTYQCELVFNADGSIKMYKFTVTT